MSIIISFLFGWRIQGQQGGQIGIALDVIWYEPITELMKTKTQQQEVWTFHLDGILSSSIMMIIIKCHCLVTTTKNSSST